MEGTYYSTRQSRFLREGTCGRLMKGLVRATGGQFQLVPSVLLVAETREQPYHIL